MTGGFLACPTPRCAGGGFDPEEEEEEEEEEEAALDVDGDDDDSDDSDVDVDASGSPGATTTKMTTTQLCRRRRREGSGPRRRRATTTARVRARPRRPCSAPRGVPGRAAEAEAEGEARRPLAEEAGDNLVAEDPLMPEATTRGVRAGLERGATAEAATARVARAGRKARGAGIAGVGFAADAVASAADAIARSDPRPSARGAAAPSGTRCLPEEARARARIRGAARVPRASGPGDATREALETGAAAFEPRAESRPRERSSDARHERGAERDLSGSGGRRGFAHAGVSSAAANARRTRTTNDPSRRRSFIVRVVAPRAGRMRSPATPASGSALFHDVERALVGVDAERAKALVSRAACDALAEVRAPRRTNAGGVRSPLPLSSFGRLLV